MLQPLLSPSTLLTLTLPLLFSASLSHHVHAQQFEPRASISPCNAFVEGQGLFIKGGLDRLSTTVKQTFMLDLSVSWNTSKPVFIKLDDGPAEDGSVCTMTGNGEEMFMLLGDTGHIYNVKSKKWTQFKHNSFATDECYVAVTDPETSITYFPNCGMDFKGKIQMLAMDLKAKTVTPTNIKLDLGNAGFAWNPYLKSMVIADMNTLSIFTPSKVSQTSNGWSNKTIAPLSKTFAGWNCAASAYGGQKMIYIGADFEIKEFSTVLHSNIYIFDVVKGTWKKGPPTATTVGSACAAVGDQFVVWGGDLAMDAPTNKTYVFNIKTEKWVTSFTAPPPPLITTTTSLASQPSETQQVLQPTTLPDPANVSSSSKNLVVIASVLSGVLVAVILGFIVVYFRRARRQRASVDEASTGSSDMKDDPNLGRLHQGSFGAQLVTEHPHAIVDDQTAGRNVQYNAVEVQMDPQVPHAVIGGGFAASQDRSRAVADYGGKQEYEEN